MSCDEKGPRTATDCTPCSPNVRNNYFRGKLMTVADYQAEQLYMIQRRRVMNRLLLGWGVVRGFRVERDGGTLAIGPGVAIDPNGREIIACDRVMIDEVDDVLWLRGGDCGLEPTKPLAAGCYLLAAHYAERRVDGVRVSTGCDDSECESNRICETVVYSLSAIDGNHPPLLALECGKLEPGRNDQPAFPKERPFVGPVDNRGQGNLCLHNPAGWEERRFDPCCPAKLSSHGDLKLDFDAGVALAIVCFKDGECGALVFTEIRPIIRGCALTRIEDIGWRYWHQKPDIVIGRKPFFEMFVKPADGKVPADLPSDDDEEERPRQKPTYPHIDTRFWVCLSAPVQIASLTRDVMSLTLVQPDSNEAVGNVLRVPIAGIWHQKTLKGDPDGTTRGFRPFITYQFWAGELRGGVVSGFRAETLVELRVHGSKIIDWAGRPIDADAVAHRLPSGNLTPGGDFVSSWRVKRGGEQVGPRGNAIPTENPPAAKNKGATA